MIGLWPFSNRKKSLKPRGSVIIIREAHPQQLKCHEAFGRCFGKPEAGFFHRVLLQSADGYDAAVKFM